MKRKLHYLIIMMLWAVPQLRAQDPAFSQFFSSPLNINPGLSANINADWRLISNVRDQWIGPASPYITSTISYDRKIQERQIPNMPEHNHFGWGAMLMYDHAMSGVVKSTYATLNGSYHLRLKEGYVFTHHLGVGFGGSYGRRYIDYYRVDFEEQFTGFGFNTTLPTGETALANMKPYFSASAGLVYTMKSERSNLDVGVAGFHLNKPRQTFMMDENQDLAMRKVAHSNFETFLNDGLVLNVNGIYQQQAGAEYFSIGGGLGYFLGDANNTLLNAGIWYWSANAVVPYIGIAYKDFQFGLSYDATISKLYQATRKPNTFELSMILRGKQPPSGVIPCPWK